MSRKIMLHGSAAGRARRGGGRVHPQTAWAKLDTLVKGAELATSQLWG
jgi:hypothetical protein